MAVAVAAARLRGILVDAAACQRQGNELEVLEQLLHIGGILATFPLPQGSPQADMIAAAVQQRATLPERQVLLLLMGHSGALLFTAYCTCPSLFLCGETMPHSFTTCLKC